MWCMSHTMTRFSSTSIANLHGANQQLRLGSSKLQNVLQSLLCNVEHGALQITHGVRQWLSLSPLQDNWTAARHGFCPPLQLCTCNPPTDESCWAREWKTHTSMDHPPGIPPLQPATQHLHEVSITLWPYSWVRSLGQHTGQTRAPETTNATNAFPEAVCCDLHPSSLQPRRADTTVQPTNCLVSHLTPLPSSSFFVVSTQPNPIPLCAPLSTEAQSGLPCTELWDYGAVFGIGVGPGLLPEARKHPTANRQLSMSGSIKADAPLFASMAILNRS